MTDYTLEQLDVIADFAADIANETAKALAEYPRLKEERDELLEAMKRIEIWTRDHGNGTCEAVNTKARETIERIDHA